MGFVWGAAALGFEICWVFGEFRSLLLPVCLESLNCRIFAQLCALGAKTHWFTVSYVFASSVDLLLKQVNEQVKASCNQYMQGPCWL